MRHVDDFIDDPDSDQYASFWFSLFRRPAIEKARFPNKGTLFATYNGKRYRVTGCSRMGDVWLHSDFGESDRYELRVDVDQCSEWSADAAATRTPGVSTKGGEGA